MKVPVPPFDPRHIYRPEIETARYFLTGGLPAPTRTIDHPACSRCGTKLTRITIETHVTGATPAVFVERHRCVAATPA